MTEAPAGFVATPPPLVERLVADALDALANDAPRVLDPACGDGALLLGAARALIRAAGTNTRRARADVVLQRLHGVEIDPELAARSRAALGGFVRGRGGPLGQTLLDALGARVQVGCALSGPLPGQASWSAAPNAPGPPLDWEQAFPGVAGFDLVLANPPYLDSEWLCRERPRWRRWLRQRFPASARGNWDLYCPFVERALDLTRPGGVLGLVLPNAVAAAHYAAGVRLLLGTRANLVRVEDWTTTRSFSQGVYPLTVVARRGAPRSGWVEQGGVRLSRSHYAGTWPLGEAVSDLVTEPGGPGAALVALESPRLSTVRGAATVREAYELVPLIEEVAEPGPEHWLLVNSGTLDPQRALWGERPLRYLGVSYRHPVVRRDALRALAPTRATLAERPKVVVAGNTRRLEALADPDGRYLPAKSTTVVYPAPGVDPDFLAGVLNSDWATRLYRQRYGGLALAGGYLRIGPPQLRELPVPGPGLACPEARALVQASRAWRLHEGKREVSQALAARLYQG